MAAKLGGTAEAQGRAFAPGGYQEGAEDQYLLALQEAVHQPTTAQGD